MCKFVFTFINKHCRPANGSQNTQPCGKPRTLGENLMIRLYLFITSLFLTSYSFGQIEKKINAVLLKGNFREFKKFVDRYRIEKGQVTISSGNVRDLTTGFQEAVFYISKSYSVNKGVSITCNPRIHLLTEGNLIIYFSLESEEMKDFPKSFEITSDTIYKFSNLPKMAALKTKFLQTYGVPLNENELFIDTVYYGQNCGIGGRPPKEQEKINDWVNNVDMVNLHKWLQSTNTEKQIYAVQGFHILSSKGVIIPEASKKYIHNILKKRGTINTCAICDARQEEISSVVSEFKL